MIFRYSAIKLATHVNVLEDFGNLIVLYTVLLKLYFGIFLLFQELWEAWTRLLEESQTHAKWSKHVSFQGWCQTSLHDYVMTSVYSVY